MKVLMIRMAPKISGAEIYNLNLIKGFKKYFNDIQVVFITNLPDFANKIKKAGAKVIILPVFSQEVGTKRGLGRLFLNLPQYLFYFLKTILNFRIKQGIKLVVFQGTTEKIVLSPVLKILSFRVIWLEHGPVFAFPKAKEVLVLYKIASNFADKIITVSHDAREDIIKGGIAAEKVICVHTGIDTDYFSPPGKTDKNLIVGYVGAICFEKGIRDFLEMAIVITQKGRGIKFALVGDGLELEWAKKVAKITKIDKDIILTGYKEEIKPYLGKFSVFFFPTLHLEGLSLSLMESMAMGVPVVARDIGGNRELVVHGKTGYLFKDETPEELVDIVVDLLKDEKKRKAMGEAARERVVKYFNQERWVKELYSVFEEVVKE